MLRIDTDVVSVDVSVTDNEGRPVRNLTKQDFKLFADGQEQALSFFQVERRAGPARPLAIVFAVDISGSMTDWVDVAVADSAACVLVKRRRSTSRVRGDGIWDERKNAAAVHH